MSTPGLLCVGIRLIAVSNRNRRCRTGKPRIRSSHCAIVKQDVLVGVQRRSGRPKRFSKRFNGQLEAGCRPLILAAFAGCIYCRRQHLLILHILLVDVALTKVSIGRFTELTRRKPVRDNAIVAAYESHRRSICPIYRAFH